jgi:hypothetical protein
VVAIWVAVQRGRAASYTEDRSSTLVQPEPIRTTAPPAANAVHSTARRYSNAPDNRQLARPPAHLASWDDGQTPSGAASSGRSGRDPRARRRDVRSAFDIERPTTFTHGQSWSLDGCRYENAQSACLHLCGVAESLLDRLINNSHQVLMNGPSYRPNKRPGQRVTKTSGRSPPSKTRPGQDLVNYVSNTPAQ